MIFLNSKLLYVFKPIFFPFALILKKSYLASVSLKIEVGWEVQTNPQRESQVSPTSDGGGCPGQRGGAKGPIEAVK